MLGDQGQRVVGVEVAGHHEHRVGRRVVLVEEVGRVRHRRALQVDEPAVPVVGVGEGVEEHRRQQQPGEAAVRPVEHVDPDLLLDHRDLVGQVFLGEPRAAHPVRLQEQAPGQRVARQHLEVVRVVQVGAAVEGAAGGLHVAEVLELLQVGRALEHQVLEEVREAGAPLRLGPDADVVVDGDRHHRGAAVRRQQDPEAVVQNLADQRVRRRGQCRSGHAPTLTVFADRCRHRARSAAGPSCGLRSTSAMQTTRSPSASRSTSGSP